MEFELTARTARITFTTVEDGKQKRTSRSLKLYEGAPETINDGLNAFVSLHANETASFLIREDNIIV